MAAPIRNTLQKTSTDVYRYRRRRASVEGSQKLTTKTNLK